MNRDRNRNQTETPALRKLVSLIGRVRKTLPQLNQYNELPGVRYDTPGALESYRAAANGELPGAGTVDTDCVLDCTEIPAFFADARSELAKAAALCVYKAAREVVHDEDVDAAIRDDLFTVLEEIKRADRNCGTPHDVVGSRDDPARWIYAYDKGPMVREVSVKSKKTGMKPLEIVQFSDTHFNYCNERDFADANPALMSTFEHRRWHANGDSVDVVSRSFAYAAMSDQTIVTGDILDYLSFGALELAQKTLFRRDPGLLAAIGGHEVTREMQGEVADPTTSESRYDLLRRFWCNDIFYESKLLGGRVIAVVMDNGSAGTYSKDQFDRLKKDLERARRENLILLIFQHEPLCTANPAETDVPFIRANDPGASRNFFRDHVGGYYTKNVLQDEWTMKTYTLIRQSSDVIRGIFCGHLHSDFYTEIIGIDQSGVPDGTVIPQYILTATVYDNLGHVMKIIVN